MGKNRYRPQDGGTRAQRSAARERREGLVEDPIGETLLIIERRREDKRAMRRNHSLGWIEEEEREDRKDKEY
jgi:hypothetical protein